MRTDRQTDKYDEANSHFSEFCETRLKWWMGEDLQGSYHNPFDILIEV